MQKGANQQAGSIAPFSHAVGLISLYRIQIHELVIFEILIDNKTKLHNRGRARYILMILTHRKINFVFIT